MIYLVTKQKALFEKLTSDISYANVTDTIKYFQNHTYIGFDSETEGFDPYTKNLISIQLGDEINQFVIDCDTINITELKELLETKTLIMHNAKFDLRFLYHQNIIPKFIYDTYLSEYVLTTGIQSARRSLDAVVYKYLKIQLDKTVRGLIHRERLSTRVIIYGAKDVAYLVPLMHKQNEKIKEQGLEHALRLDNKFVRVLAYFEYCGIYLNADKWKDKVQKDQIHFDKARKQLEDWILSNNLTKYIDAQLDLFNPERQTNINWSSSHQVIPLLKDLGVDTKIKDKKTGQWKDSCEAKHIQSQVDKSDFIPLYLEYKKQEKVITTYGNNFINQINPISKRIHPNYSQLMNTGRLSSGGKDKDTGLDSINIQNIPADENTRGCFTNQFEDTILIDADYSGQEAVVFANKCLDKNLLKFYDKGLGDMHSYVAKLSFAEELQDINLKDIKELRPDLRQLAKKAGFALQFGGVGATIAANVNISIEEGNSVEEAYFKAFPEVKDYFDKVCKETLQQGYILFNEITKRKSYIDFYPEYKRLEKQLTPDFWKQYRDEKQKNSSLFINNLKPIVSNYFQKKGIIERRAKNFPVQGSSADITKLAGIYLFEYLEQQNLLFKVLLSAPIHDEILLESPKEISSEIAKKLEECMEKAGKVFYTRVPLKATAIISNKWEH